MNNNCLWIILLLMSCGQNCSNGGGVMTLPSSQPICGSPQPFCNSCSPQSASSPNCGMCGSQPAVQPSFPCEQVVWTPQPPVNNCMEQMLGLLLLCGCMHPAQPLPSVVRMPSPCNQCC